MEPTSKPPVPPLFDVTMLTKANLLGIGLFLILSLSAGLVYVLLALVGVESSVARVLLAVFVGPLLVGVIVAIFWRQILTRLQSVGPDTTPKMSSNSANSETL